MPSVPIPRYPVIIVDVAADGSAHVNVAGRHIDYPSGPIADTRAAIIRYGVELAQTMARPVRMSITDPQGAWNLAVYPDGTVADLAPATAKPTRRRKKPVEHKAATTITSAIEGRREPEATPAPATVTAPTASTTQVETPVTPVGPGPGDRGGVESTLLDQQTPGLPVALLMFSTGETVALSGSAIIGRRPAFDDGETSDQLVSVNDESRTISKTHFRIESNDGTIWIIDQQSGNGTSVQRAGNRLVRLVPWEPYAIRDGDVVHIGDLTFTVSLQPSTQQTENGR